MNAVIRPEKKAHKVSGRFHGYNTGLLVMTKKQRILFYLTIYHTLTVIQDPATKQ
jgi:hypothetical protein